jgi:hypothetical protein
MLHIQVQEAETDGMPTISKRYVNIRVPRLRLMLKLDPVMLWSGRGSVARQGKANRGVDYFGWLSFRPFK